METSGCTLEELIDELAYLFQLYSETRIDGLPDRQFRLLDEDSEVRSRNLEPVVDAEYVLEEVDDPPEGMWDLCVEDVSWILVYNAFREAWVLGYYPTDGDTGFEIRGADLEDVLYAGIRNMTNRLSFAAGDIEQCVTTIEEELEDYVNRRKNDSEDKWY